MGLDPEYSERHLCEMTGCNRDAEWVVNVQWSVADFIDCAVCGEDLPFTIEYWQRFTADGVEPAISADELIR